MTMNASTLSSAINESLKGTLKEAYKKAEAKTKAYYSEGGAGYNKPADQDKNYDIIATEVAQVVADAVATEVVNHIKTYMSVKGIKATLDTSLNSVFTAGVPVPMDGGAALQIAWKAGTAGGIADKSTQNNDGTGHVE